MVGIQHLFWDETQPLFGLVSKKADWFLPTASYTQDMRDTRLDHPFLVGRETDGGDMGIH